MSLLQGNLNLLGYDPPTGTSVFVDVKSDMIHRVTFLLSKLYDRKWSPTELSKSPAKGKQTKTAIQRTFITAILKILEDLKKQGDIPSDCLLRKSYFEECRGERYDYTILALSNLVLRRVLEREEGFYTVPFKTLKKGAEADTYLRDLKQSVADSADDLVQSSIQHTQFKVDCEEFEERMESIRQTLVKERSFVSRIDDDDDDDDDMLRPQSSRSTQNSITVWTRANKANFSMVRKFLNKGANAHTLRLPESLCIPPDLVTAANSTSDEPLTLYDESGLLNLADIARLWLACIERLLGDGIECPVGLREKVEGLTRKMQEDNLALRVEEMEKEVCLLKEYVDEKRAIEWAKIDRARLQQHQFLSAAYQDSKLDYGVDRELFDALVALSESVDTDEEHVVPVIIEKVPLSTTVISPPDIEKENANPSKIARRIKSSRDTAAHFKGKPVASAVKQSVLKAISDEIVREMITTDTPPATKTQHASSAKLIKKRTLLPKSQLMPITPTKLRQPMLSETAFKTRAEIPRTPLKTPIKSVLKPDVIARDDSLRKRLFRETPMHVKKQAQPIIPPDSPNVVYDRKKAIATHQVVTPRVEFRIDELVISKESLNDNASYFDDDNNGGFVVEDLFGLDEDFLERLESNEF